MSGSITAMGIMSGTSLDGIDLAICEFLTNGLKWEFRVLFSRTYLYSKEWKASLSTAHCLDSVQLLKLDREYGIFIGKLAHDVIKEQGIVPDIISSHGHTIFHKPEEGYTLQIGHGNYIAAETGIPVVSDFRSADIAHGGQGAPLVPVGDHLLFSESEACLNLGGIANISFVKQGKRLAGDICPVNMALNKLVGIFNKAYDEDGSVGSKGKCDSGLLEELNSLEYYHRDFPKSMGREWFEAEFMKVLDKSGISELNKLTTVYHHIADQISGIIEGHTIRSVLMTGGGAKNKFLDSLFIDRSECNWIIPDNTILDFKEAIIFAFLGVLRTRNEINCYASVTGAKKDTVCGVIYV